jgi:hypothetical protein
MKIKPQAFIQQIKGEIKMNICPVCNGLTDYVKYCSKCGSKMEISSRIEDEDDSYAPYENYNITDLNDGDPPDICSHIAECKTCRIKEIIKINLTPK